MVRVGDELIGGVEDRGSLRVDLLVGHEDSHVKWRAPEIENALKLWNAKQD